MRLAVALIGVVPPACTVELEAVAKGRRGERRGEQAALLVESSMESWWVAADRQR